MTLSVTDRAPDFELSDYNDETYRLSDFRGVPVVLIFFPMAFSPVCQEEHACVVDVMSRFNQLEAEVVGVSVDHKWALAAFAKAQGIEYPLLSDFQPRGAVGSQYDVYQEDLGINLRWTYVIDPEGRIAYIQKSEIGEVPDMDELIKAVEEAL
jgi:peroxiredoxin (alkyl hydroperoxide reductase subunit C)